LSTLDVSGALRGKRILFTGSTGFVGKVGLSMLLHRYPDLGKVFVLVRPGTGGSAEARFFDKVMGARPFDPLRARHGMGFERFMREKCVPIAGDIADPMLGISPADLAAMGSFDLLLNCAGLVDFNPSLEHAIGVNVRGVQHGVDLCRTVGAAMVHVSTCFVAGNRDGVVYEDEEIAGYFPRREGVEGRPKESTLDARDFDLDQELADCERRMAQIREVAEDRVHQSSFRNRALTRLRAEGRRDDEKALRMAVGREKRLWISQELVKLGMDRALHWGWPNTYTYTKSLGEQTLARSGLRWAIARPAIVESSLRYPFPGWNEGFTTSAPLAFIALKGHRSYPAAEKAILDMVPVDLVASGVIAVAAHVLSAPPEHPRRVYHLASGDVNPFWVRRCIDLLGLSRRRFLKNREEGNRTLNKILARFEPYPVTGPHYRTWSDPALARAARATRDAIRKIGPRWGAPKVSALADALCDELDEWESRFQKTQTLWELFMPFVWENRYVFRCANIRELYGQLGPEDREAIPWDPERIDWRHYWLDVHMKGMEEWVFPGLEAESKKKVHGVKQHRDLLELFEATCELHKNRVALRMTGERKERFTYGELRAHSDRVARNLIAGGVRPGERVMLVSENRPEWAISYFGILLAGATAVPVDAELSTAELVNLARASEARVVLHSERVLERRPELVEAGRAAGLAMRLMSLAEALARPPANAPETRKGSGPDDVASLIFTSGTTGQPKGVMLSHRNFASLVAKLAATFDLGSGDALLSVLPLHHTFEFTCGLLVPLFRGAEVSYLDELTSDTLGEALEEGRITAMIGVPALWSLLHRRITQELAARPGWVEQAVQQLRKTNAKLREETPFNLGKLLFWPIHRRLGGGLRLMVSGGSALSPEVQQAFHEMGFNIYEGYGLTEAAPVLTVSSPADGAMVAGSVGKALPGIELRIHEPDEAGVGEVIAKGPNVMAGYFGDKEATAAAIREGWLHTGDLGRLDEAGNLYLVGRKKDVIIDANGKNVYPDELEELYRDPEIIQELSIVGLPDDAGEKVAMLVVPCRGEGDRAAIRGRIDGHIKAVSAGLPFYKRVKLWHLVDRDLPKTATRKVKRKEVVEILKKLEEAGQKGKARVGQAGSGWLVDLLARVSRRPRSEIGDHTRLASDLSLDSLMLTEVSVALEEAGVPLHLIEDLSQVTTVGELRRIVESAPRRSSAPAVREEAAEGRVNIPVPEGLASLGRAVLSAGQQALYQKLFDTRVVGEAYVPRNRNFLVVANHASHLDMGLVKVALGDQGNRLAALAASDYFFDTPLKRAYFENFTNLIPMDRSGSFKKSLRSALAAMRGGYNLLIFPEGTRSTSGRMGEFKSTAGYLALHGGLDVLPVYLHGTHDALPKGSVVPRQTRLEVRIGPAISADHLKDLTESLARSDAYKVVTAELERAVLALRDGMPSATPGLRQAQAERAEQAAFDPAGACPEPRRRGLAEAERPDGTPPPGHTRRHRKEERS
jgi:long-chain acyl-CoA synthetase